MVAQQRQRDAAATLLGVVAGQTNVIQDHSAQVFDPETCLGATAEQLEGQVATANHMGTDLSGVGATMNASTIIVPEPHAGRQVDSHLNKDYPLLL